MPLPSVFFIGDNGAVLEIIIDSSLSPDDLFAKINTILVKSGRLSVSAATANLLTAEVEAAAFIQTATAITATSSTSTSAVNDEEQERQKAAVLQKAKEAIERVRKEKEAEMARVRE